MVTIADSTRLDDAIPESARFPRRTSRLFQGLWHMLRNWQRRRQARAELARIDARTLADAGISPQIARFEANQPFWQPLRPLRDLHGLPPDDR